jgi:hypothetical protein
VSTSDARLARRQLGVDYVKRGSVISEVAKAIRGGKEKLMECARRASELDLALVPVIEKWDKLSRTARNGANLDQVCEIAGVDPYQFLASVATNDRAALVAIAIGILPEDKIERIAQELRTGGIRDPKKIFLRSSPVPETEGARKPPLNGSQGPAQSHAANLFLPWLYNLIPGGKFGFMELARCAPQVDPRTQGIVAVWDALTLAGQQVADWNLICRVKGVDPIHFFAVVAAGALKYCNTAILLVAALNSPTVFDRIVHEARKPKGTKQRKMLMQLYGVLPTPKGAQAPLPNQFAARPTRQRS